MTEIVPQPHNTAISRSQVSAPLRFLYYRKGLITKQHWVLDYGCGKGGDVYHMNNYLGVSAEGYDPYGPFGFSSEVRGRFDVVLMTYVLNVIDDYGERRFALSDAWHYVKPGGNLFITTRSVKDIEKAAKAKTPWIKHADGYWSDPRRGMFQTGIDLIDIEELSRNLPDIEAITSLKTNPCIVQMKRSQ
jgi:DNA phosphorothioation-associated putative methyltransferase